MTNSKPSASQLVAKAASHDIPASEELALPDTEQDLSEHKLQYEIDSLRQRNQEAVDTHNLRIKYANKVFGLVCAWLSCVILIVIFSGFYLWEFNLSDKVLITFIVSTTLNVLGLFAIVAKWIFQQNSNKTKSKNK